MNISACGTRTTFQNDSAADLSKTDFAHKCGVRHVSTLLFVAGMGQGHHVVQLHQLQSMYVATIAWLQL